MSSTTVAICALTHKLIKAYHVQLLHLSHHFTFQVITPLLRKLIAAHPVQTSSYGAA